MRLRVRQENNIAHRIHKIHRMSSSAWSESETNRNSVCSVLSVCKQIRVDPRDTLETNNQRDFTDETVAMRGVFLSPRITGITRIFCVIRAISWQHKNLCALCAFAWEKDTRRYPWYAGDIRINVISQMKQFPCGMHFYSWDPRDWLARPSVRVQKKNLKCIVFLRESRNELSKSNHFIFVVWTQIAQIARILFVRF